MSEKFPSIQEGEVGLEQHLAKRFQDENTAFKVRKIELLEEAGLPIPKSDILRPEEVGLLEEAILSRRLEDPATPLIIRFACVPDRFSMPAVFVEPESDIDEIIDKIKLSASNNRQIKQIILQELTPQAEAKNKISGRYLLENSQVYPLEEILELYKGSRSTNVLNNPYVTDPNFLRFEKRASQFMIPNKKIDESISFTELEIRDIYSTLQSFKEKISLIKEVIALSKGKKPEEVVVSIEFSYNKGRMVFSDID